MERYRLVPLRGGHGDASEGSLQGFARMVLCPQHADRICQAMGACLLSEANDLKRPLPIVAKDSHHSMYQELAAISSRCPATRNQASFGSKPKQVSHQACLVFQDQQSGCEPMQFSANLPSSQCSPSTSLNQSRSRKFPCPKGSEDFLHAVSYALANVSRESWQQRTMLYQVKLKLDTIWPPAPTISERC